MAIIGHKCDRCSETIPADRTLVLIQCGPLRRSHPAADLCVSCAGDLAAFLSTHPDDPGAIQPVPIPRVGRSAEPHEAFSRRPL